MDKNRIIAVVEVVFAVVVWGASFVATKVALRYVLPVPLVWVRFAFGVVILGAATVWRGQFAYPKREELGYFALLGFLGITLHQWLQSTALLTAQATTTSWIIATTPVFMALLGWGVLKEEMTPMIVLGIVLAALGVLLVVSKGDFSTLAKGSFGTPGDFLVLISAVNWAVFTVLSRRGLQRHPATRMMFFVMAFGWLFSGAMMFTSPGIGDIKSIALEGWVAILFLGTFVSGLAYIAWYDALKVIPSSQLGVFLYMEPLVTLVFAAVLLAEPLSWQGILGGVIILIGVWIVNRSG